MHSFRSLPSSEQARHLSENQALPSQQQQRSQRRKNKSNKTKKIAKPRGHRQPLQELPISKKGNLLVSREPVLRPIPSLDQENMRAVVQALYHRNIFVNREVQRLTRILNNLKLRYQRLQRSANTISSQRVRANSNQATRGQPNSRLSMPFDSEASVSGSDSEPELSVLGMVHRRRAAEMEPQANVSLHDYEQEPYGMEDTGIDEQVEDEQEQEPDVNDLVDPAMLGLKEISNLGKFTVSSHKQGNGVDELRSDDLKLYWQSDGPQPHKLTVYFVKRVGIREIRFFVDYAEDESYTPTKIVFKSGTSENNLIEFAAMHLESPSGWQQVPIAGAGGDPDGNTLVSYVLQMQILENHQNGKDTHLRGIKIYAFDADAIQGGDPEGNRMEDVVDAIGNVENRTTDDVARLDDISRALASARLESGETAASGFPIPDFMREPELR